MAECKPRGAFEGAEADARAGRCSLDPGLYMVVAKMGQLNSELQTAK